MAAKAKDRTADSLEKALKLMRRAAKPTEPNIATGFLDLSHEESDPKGADTVAQKLMVSAALPMIYERWWRPVWSRFGHGIFGPGMRDEYETALRLLSPEPGDVVLDVACGPGNFTRRFAAAVGQAGLAIGTDVSESMLARAIAENPPRNTCFIRADALDLPFRDATIDACCCFAALNLFESPMEAIEEMHRVLKPGGKIALMTTCGSGFGPLIPIENTVGQFIGVRIFGREEIVTTLETLGFEHVSREIMGGIQIVGGRKP